MLDLAPRTRSASPYVASGLTVEPAPTRDDGDPREGLPLEEAFQLIVLTKPGLAEALALLEGAYWDPDKHPRWPAGTPGGLGGKFMAVGQRVEIGGVQYDIEAVLPGKIHARVATKGATAGAKTVEFDAKTLQKAVRPAAEPMVEPTKAQIASTGKAGTYTVIDPYVDPSSHDPSIPIPEAAKGHISPEQWKRFGRLDQEKYAQVMERFGKWKPGQAKGLIDDVLSKVPSSAKQAVLHAMQSQHGSSSGKTLSLHNLASKIKASIKGTSQADLARQEYEAAKHAQSEMAAVLQWDLYNRARAPDISIFHKTTEPHLFQSKVLGQAQPVFSGLSQSQHYRHGWWKPSCFATPMAIRHIVMSTSSANVVNMYASEKEVAVADPFYADPKRSIVWTDSQIDVAKAKWLEGASKAGASGEVLEQFIAALNGQGMLPVPEASPNLVMDSASGKQYVEPPPEAKVADGSGKKIADLKPVDIVVEGTVIPAGTPHAANELGLKPGDYIQGNKEHATLGTKYLIVKDPADPYMGLAYLKLTEPDGVTPFHGTEVYHFGNAGKSKFKKLEGHFELPEQEAGQGIDFNPLGFTESAETKFIGTFMPGEKFKLYDNPYEVVAKIDGASTQVKSLETGELGKLNNDYKSPWLIPLPGHDEQGHVLFDEGGFLDAGEVTVGELQAGDVIRSGKTVYKIDAPGHQLDPSTATILSAADGKKIGQSAELPPAGKGTKLVAKPPGWTPPEVGDTVAIAGKKATVTKLLKDGSVQLNLAPGVLKLKPEDAQLAGLFSPAHHQLGDKAKLKTLEPGTKFHGGTGGKVRPYVVVEQQGKTTLVRNLDTGQESAISSAKSFAVLHPKAAQDAGAEDASTKTIPGASVAFDPDAFEFGPSKTYGELQVGDLVSSGMKPYEILSLEGDGLVKSLLDGKEIPIKTGGGFESQTVSTLVPKGSLPTGTVPQPKKASEYAEGEHFLFKGSVFKVVAMSPSALKAKHVGGPAPAQGATGVGNEQTSVLSDGTLMAFMDAKFITAPAPGTSSETGAAPAGEHGDMLDIVNVETASDEALSAALAAAYAKKQGGGLSGPAAEKANAVLAKLTAGKPKKKAKGLEVGTWIIDGTDPAQITKKHPGGGVELTYPDGHVVGVSSGNVSHVVIPDPEKYGQPGAPSAANALNWAVNEDKLSVKALWPGDRFVWKAPTGKESVFEVTVKGGATGIPQVSKVKPDGTLEPAGDFGDKDWEPEKLWFAPKATTAATAFNQEPGAPDGATDATQDIPAYTYDPSAYVPFEGQTLAHAVVGDIFVGAKNGKHYLVTKTGAPSGLTALDLTTGKTSTPWKYDKQAVLLKPKATNVTPYEQLSAGDPVQVGKLKPGDHLEINGATYEVAQTQYADEEAPQIDVHPVLADGSLGPKGTAGTFPLAVVTFKAKAADVQAQKEMAAAAASAPVDATALPQAEMNPFSPKSKSGGGYVFSKVKLALEGQLLQDKSGKVWKVKQAGAVPVLSDGQAHFTATGDENLKVVEMPFQDDAPPVGTDFPSNVQVGAQALETPTVEGETPWTAGELDVGDTFTVKSQAASKNGTWVVTSKGEHVVMATKLGTAKTKAFDYSEDISSWKPASAATKTHGETVVPSMLKVGDMFSGGGTPGLGYYTVLSAEQSDDGAVLALSWTPTKPGTVDPVTEFPAANFPDAQTTTWKAFDPQAASGGVKASSVEVGDKIAWTYGQWELTGTVASKAAGGSILVDVDPGDHDFDKQFGLPPNHAVKILDPGDAAGDFGLTPNDLALSQLPIGALVQASKEQAGILVEPAVWKLVGFKDGEAVLEIVRPSGSSGEKQQGFQDTFNVDFKFAFANLTPPSTGGGSSYQGDSADTTFGAIPAGDFFDAHGATWVKTDYKAAKIVKLWPGFGQGAPVGYVEVNWKDDEGVAQVRPVEYEPLPGEKLAAGKLKPGDSFHTDQGFTFPEGNFEVLPGKPDGYEGKEPPDHADPVWVKHESGALHWVGGKLPVLPLQGAQAQDWKGVEVGDKWLDHKGVEMTVVSLDWNNGDPVAMSEGPGGEKSTNGVGGIAGSLLKAQPPAGTAGQAFASALSKGDHYWLDGLEYEVLAAPKPASKPLKVKPVGQSGPIDELDKGTVVFLQDPGPQDDYDYDYGPGQADDEDEDPPNLFDGSEGDTFVFDGEEWTWSHEGPVQGVITATNAAGQEQQFDGNMVPEWTQPDDEDKLLDTLTHEWGIPMALSDDEWGDAVDALIDGVMNGAAQHLSDEAYSAAQAAANPYKNDSSWEGAHVAVQQALAQGDAWNEASDMADYIADLDGQFGLPGQLDDDEFDDAVHEVISKLYGINAASDLSDEAYMGGIEAGKEWKVNSAPKEGWKELIRAVKRGVEGSMTDEDKAKTEWAASFPEIPTYAPSDLANTKADDWELLSPEGDKLEMTDDLPVGAVFQQEDSDDIWIVTKNTDMTTEAIPMSNPDEEPSEFENEGVYVMKLKDSALPKPDISFTGGQGIGEPVFALPATKDWSEFKEGDEAWTLGGKHGVFTVPTSGPAAHEKVFLIDGDPTPHSFTGKLYVADPLGGVPLEPSGKALFSELPAGAHFQSIAGKVFYKSGFDEATSVDTGQVTKGIVQSMPVTKLGAAQPAPNPSSVSVPEGLTENTTMMQVGSLPVGSTVADEYGTPWKIVAFEGDWASVTSPDGGLKGSLPKDMMPTSYSSADVLPSSGLTAADVASWSSAGLVPGSELKVGDVVKTPLGKLYEVVGEGVNPSAKNLETGNVSNLLPGAMVTKLVPPGGPPPKVGETVRPAELGPGDVFKDAVGTVYRVIEKGPPMTGSAWLKLEVLEGGKIGEVLEGNYPESITSWTLLDSAPYDVMNMPVNGTMLEVGKWYWDADGEGSPFEVTSDGGDHWWVEDFEAAGHISKDPDQFYTELPGPPAPTYELDGPDDPGGMPDPDEDAAAQAAAEAAPELKPFSPKSQTGGGYYFGTLGGIPNGTEFKDKSGATFTKVATLGDVGVYEDAQGNQLSFDGSAKVKLLGPLKASVPPSAIDKIKSATSSSIPTWDSPTDMSGKVKATKLSETKPGQKIVDAAGSKWTVLGHIVKGEAASAVLEGVDGVVVKVPPLGYVRVGK